MSTVVLRVARPRYIGVGTVSIDTPAAKVLNVALDGEDILMIRGKVRRIFARCKAPYPKEEGKAIDGRTK